jgi:two-component system, LytTR family, sensor histidine kinase AlgZ
MTDKSINPVPVQTDDRQGIIPDLCEARNLFIVILLCLVSAIVFALVASSSRATFWDSLASSAFVILWIALLNVAVLCLSRRVLGTLSVVYIAITSFVIMMVITVSVTLVITHYIVPRLPAFIVDSDSFDASWYLLRVITISAVIYLLLLRYFYIQHQWRLNLLANSEARIQSLRARIRPHFLFNSMNTIASLIAISPEKAETAIEDLSDLFRASLNERNFTELQDEISLTQSYLEIEQLRLGDRLQIHWQIDDQVLATPVPALCLQPLVENAIYHGIEPIKKGGKITISALHINNRLELAVSNPISHSGKSDYHKGNQMAQDNIHQRLRLVYGNEAEFSINDTKDSYTVTLHIPLGVKNERSDR